MIDCRFITPCGLCSIKSMNGLPVQCEGDIDYKIKVYPPSSKEEILSGIKQMDSSEVKP